MLLLGEETLVVMMTQMYLLGEEIPVVTMTQMSLLGVEIPLGMMTQVPLLREERVTMQQKRTAAVRGRGAPAAACSF